MRDCERQAIGHDLIGMARMLEALSLGLRDHRLVFHACFTKREEAATELVEGLTGRAANSLRKIGNRMIQKRLP